MLTKREKDRIKKAYALMRSYGIGFEISSDHGLFNPTSAAAIIAYINFGTKLVDGKVILTIDKADKI